MHPYLADFPPRPAGEVALHFHEGSEFIYVLEGTVLIRCRDEDQELAVGDSLYFDSSEPHGYRGGGRGGGKAVVITIAPRI